MYSLMFNSKYSEIRLPVSDTTLGTSLCPYKIPEPFLVLFHLKKTQTVYLGYSTD